MKFSPVLLIILLLFLFSCATGGPEAGTEERPERGLDAGESMSPERGVSEGDAGFQAGEEETVGESGSDGESGSADRLRAVEETGEAESGQKDAGWEGTADPLSQEPAEELVPETGRRGMDYQAYLAAKKIILELLEPEVPGRPAVESLENLVRQYGGRLTGAETAAGLPLCSLRLLQETGTSGSNSPGGGSGLEGRVLAGFDGSMEGYRGIDIRNRILLIDLAGMPPGWGAVSLAQAAEWGAGAVVFLNGGGRFFKNPVEDFPAFFLSDTVESAVFNDRLYRIIPAAPGGGLILSGSFGRGETGLEFEILYSGPEAEENQRFASETALLLEAGHRIAEEGLPLTLRFTIILEPRATAGDSGSGGETESLVRAGSVLLPPFLISQSRLFGFTPAGGKVLLAVGPGASEWTALIRAAEKGTEDPAGRGLIFEEGGVTVLSDSRSELERRRALLLQAAEHLNDGELGAALEKGLYRLDRAGISRYFTPSAAKTAGLLYPPVLAELILSLELKRGSAVVMPDFAGEIDELRFWARQYASVLAAPAGSF